MSPLLSSVDPSHLLVADASTVINLNATGCAESILRALPNRVAVVDAIPDELELGRRRGRRNTDLLNDLIAMSLVAVVQLDEASGQHFESLVVGSAAMTLDDGEAATIAYAIAHGAVAIIDERKANRICSERFPALGVISTVDLFAQPAVLEALGQDKLAQAILNALQLARMRVLAHRVDWVVQLIGPHQAALCASLPRAVRHTKGSL
jgi:predicted nucleic acid-binding protein